MSIKTSMGIEAARLIRERRPLLVDEAIEAFRRLSPGQWEGFGDSGKAHCRADFAYHFDYLAEALAYDDPLLFTTYVDWLKRLFAAKGYCADGVSPILETVRAALDAVLPRESALAAGGLLDAAGILEDGGTALRQDIGTLSPPGGAANAYLEALLSGDRGKATDLVMDLVHGGLPVKAAYTDIFQASQEELGRRWMSGDISVAQEHFCTAATQAIMSLLYPQIFATPRNGKRLVAASVGGELHEIGIRMLADFFELEGWDSYYLGANTPPASIVAALRDRKASLLCLSATMAYNLSGIESVITRVRETFPEGAIRILVGGGPFNVSPDLWRRIGADGSARDAPGALEIAATLLPGRAAG